MPQTLRTCPGRGAARSAAKRCTADPGPRLLRTENKPGSGVCSAMRRFASHCGAPGTRKSGTARWSCLRPAHLVARGLHRLDDVLVAGTAAEIGRQHVEQVLIADIGMLLQHVGGEHQEAGRAEAALQSMMRDEGALQRMQILWGAEPFDRSDLLALRLHRKHQARAHGLAIDDHRAGAADAVLATDVRAGLSAILDGERSEENTS